VALKACKKCGGTIDSSAQTSPHCGAKLHWSDLETLPFGALFVYGGGGFVVLVLLVCVVSLFKGCGN